MQEQSEPPETTPLVSSDAKEQGQAHLELANLVGDLKKQYALRPSQGYALRDSQGNIKEPPRLQGVKRCACTLCD